MANLNPFRPSQGITKTLSASSSSSSVTFDAKDVSSGTTNAGTIGGHCIIRVYNSGTAVAFARWGTGAQTATTSDMPLIPGVVEVFSKAFADDTFAAITSSSTATIYVTCGEGV